MSGRADPEEVEVSLCPVGDVSAVPEEHVDDGVEENDEDDQGTNRRPEEEGEGSGTDRWRSFGLDASMSSVRASKENDDGAGVVEAEARAGGPRGDESVASAVENREGEERSADDGHSQFLCLASKSGGVELEIAQVHIDSTAALHEFLEQARAVIASGVDLDAAPHPAVELSFREEDEELAGHAAHCIQRASTASEASGPQRAGKLPSSIVSYSSAGGNASDGSEGICPVAQSASSREAEHNAGVSSGGGGFQRGSSKGMDGSVGSLIREGSSLAVPLRIDGEENLHALLQVVRCHGKEGEAALDDGSMRDGTIRGLTAEAVKEASKLNAGGTSSGSGHGPPPPAAAASADQSNLNADEVFSDQMSYIEKLHVPWNRRKADDMTLVVMEVQGNFETFLRTDMNRMDLLSACVGPLREAMRKAQAPMPSAAVLRLQDVQLLQRVREPAILPRRGATVVNLYPIAALITINKAFLVLPDGTDGWLEKFIRELKEERDKAHATAQNAVSHDGAHADTVSFEMTLLEVLLASSVHHHQKVVDDLLQEARKNLRDLKHVGQDLLLKIWRMKKELADEQQAVSKTLAALEELQDDESLLSLIYITALVEDPIEFEKRVADETGNTTVAEGIIDIFALSFSGLKRKLALALEEIEDSEELIEFQLDKSRNNLIVLDVTLSLVSAWISAAIFVGGLGGMNVYVGRPDDGPDDNWYWSVNVITSGVGVTVAVGVTLLIMLWLGIIRRE